MGEKVGRIRALALVGMPGSGKSKCAQILREEGYPSFRFGSIVIAEVERRGLSITPENERVVREGMRATEGMAVMAKRALPILQKMMQEKGCVVIDGLYSQSEYRYLRTEMKDDLALLAIVASKKLRYQRLAEREERFLSATEAELRDFQEIEALEKGGPIALADYTIVNDGSEAELQDRLIRILAAIGFAKKEALAAFG